MTNLQLFERLNASAATPHWQIAAAVVIAQWVIWAVLLGLVLAWLRGDDGSRAGLLEILLAVLVALALAQLVKHAWPQPRPFTLHFGSQFLAHTATPGLPSDHTTVLWSLACAAWATHRFRPWALPLFVAGLAVGWSRVYLGVHFPLDIAAALPVGVLGALVARASRRPLQPLYSALLQSWNRAVRWALPR